MAVQRSGPAASDRPMAWIVAEHPSGTGQGGEAGCGKAFAVWPMTGNTEPVSVVNRFAFFEQGEVRAFKIRCGLRFGSGADRFAVEMSQCCDMRIQHPRIERLLTGFRNNALPLFHVQPGSGHQCFQANTTMLIAGGLHE